MSKCQNEISLIKDQSDQMFFLIDVIGAEQNEKAEYKRSLQTTHNKAKDESNKMLKIKKLILFQSILFLLAIIVCAIYIFYDYKL